jgi:hypothetical protein
MNTTKILVLMLMVLLVSLTVAKCKHEVPGTSSAGMPTPPTQTSVCSADTVYFASEILPLIVSNCATTGCHDAITRKERVELTSYITILKTGAGRILSAMTASGESKMPPRDRPQLTSTQITRFQKWIIQGTKNNLCASCDTTIFTYSAISVITNTFCMGCHNPASLGGGIDLSNYTAVKASAGGRMMGSIRQVAGYSSMPKGSKLTDCQITQIQKWINAGMLNN